MTSVLYVVTFFVIINASRYEKKVFTVFNVNRGILHTLEDMGYRKI